MENDESIQASAATRSELNRARAAYRSSLPPSERDQRYRDLFDQLQESVIIYRVERDARGEVVDWIIDDCNLQAREKLGRPFGEALGRRTTALFGREVMEPYFEVSRRLDGTHDVETFETYFEYDQRYYLSSVFFLTRELYVNVSADVTERRRAERDKLNLQLQLHQSQKLEALGSLAGGIAHDFNNVLQPILGNVELLLDRPGLDEELGDGLGMIKQGALRARDLTRQILSFTQRDEEEPRVARLQPMIRESVAMMRAVMPPSVRIVEDVDPQAPAAKVNPTGVHQIVMNLLTNSHHAMESEGGEVRIGLSAVQGEGGSPRHLLLEVEDTGPGIAPAHLERIFEPFFSTKAKGQGTGLGLAVVHGIVSRFGGAIDVVSERGEGTRFSIRLPVADEAPEPPRQETANVEAVDSARVMLVDDEAMIVTVSSRMLERLGFQVTAFTNPHDALASFRATPQDFDLLVTDLSMPTMSGVTLAKQVHTIRPDLPIVACSGYLEADDEGSLSRAGVRKTLVKPVLKNDFGAALFTLLAEAERA